MIRKNETVQVFTAGEKRLLRAHLFKQANLDHVDFSSADLRDAMFEQVSLRGCDFSDTNLRGAVFLGCDLRSARFARACFGENRFDECWFVGATGIGRFQRARIEQSGGRFLAVEKEARQK